MSGPVRLEGFDQFAKVPEAMLYAGCEFDGIDYTHLEPVTDGEMRAYAVLVRHGQSPDNCYPSARRMSALLRKEIPTVRAIMRSLEAKGWIKRVARFDDATGRQTSNGVVVYAYPPVVPDHTPPIDSDHNLEREQSEREQLNEKTPPVVPLGEGDGNNPGTLFDDKPTARTERLTAHERRSQTVEASFAPWWESYPSGKSRGQRGQALKAWRRVVTDKGRDRNGDPITSADLHRRLANYRAARALYHDHWAEHGVEARAPLMNGSTFINSKSSLWADEWTLDDVAGYWPPPRGSSWEDPDNTRRGESIQDILEAEIAADLAAREEREAQNVG